LSVSLTGSSVPLLPLCQPLGQGLVYLDELFGAAETLGQVKAFPGRRLAILTNGGRIGLLAVAPTRVTPIPRTTSSRSKLRTPPAAFTCTCGGAQRRISFRSSSVAPLSP
jgi:hypothetical protein